MAATDHDPVVLTRVVPRRILVRNALWSYLLISLALFGSLYYLSIPRGTWPGLVAGQLVTILVCLTAYLRYRLTYIEVTTESIIERGFFGFTRRIPLSRVATTVLAETYRSHAPDSTPQLVVRDAAGRRLLRMRGTFWSLAAIRRVADATGVPTEHYPDPITSREFFANFPGSAYWFEHRPALFVVTVLAVFAVSLAVVLGLMWLAGIPMTLGD
ncbi:YdbT family protein [Marisediminicola antarctica]|uniref:PH domain-containing protein n=1 Tax=Marisediminicola antarctica TaxID=674079 RepID=A0A7L5ADP6_9MICO|nr:hypothetical protein [Marisediminicola antarctica]QHO68348.1 hypothetical protein BHD05_00510 [Marisediminicola antarctica]